MCGENGKRPSAICDGALRSRHPERALFPTHRVEIPEIRIDGKSIPNNRLRMLLGGNKETYGEKGSVPFVMGDGVIGLDRIWMLELI